MRANPGTRGSIAVVGGVGRALFIVGIVFAVYLAVRWAEQAGGGREAARTEAPPEAVDEAAVPATLASGARSEGREPLAAPRELRPQVPVAAGLAVAPPPATPRRWFAHGSVSGERISSGPVVVRLIADERVYSMASIDVELSADATEYRAEVTRLIGDYASPGYRITGWMEAATLRSRRVEARLDQAVVVAASDGSTIGELRIDLIGEPAGQIRGQLDGLAGHADRATVGLFAPPESGGAPVAVRSTRPDADGRFRISVDEAIEGWLGVFDHESRPTTLEIRCGLSEVVEVGVLSLSKGLSVEGVVTHVEACHSFGPRRVSMSLSTESDSAAIDGRIYAWCNGAFEHIDRSELVSADGGFRLRGAGPFRYVLNLEGPIDACSPAGGTGNTWRIEAPASGLVLDDSLAVLGVRVLDHRGQPLRGARIVITDTAGNASDCSTAANGQRSFLVSAGREYATMVQAVAHLPIEARSPQLRAGECREIEFQLVAADLAGILEIELVPPEGCTVKTAGVSGHARAPGLGAPDFSHHAAVEAPGYLLRTPLVPSGPYRVVVWPDGTADDQMSSQLLPATVDLVLVPRETTRTRIPLTLGARLSFTLTGRHDRATPVRCKLLDSLDREVSVQFVLLDTAAGVIYRHLPNVPFQQSTHSGPIHVQPALAAGEYTLVVLGEGQETLRRVSVAAGQDATCEVELK